MVAPDMRGRVWCSRHRSAHRLKSGSLSAILYLLATIPVLSLVTHL
jgi:hypothetical protein